MKTQKLYHMKKQLSFVLILVSMAIITINFSCKTEVKDDKDTIDSQAISDSLMASDEDLVFYSFPSSQEMFSFFKKGSELVYRNDLVNPKENIYKYIDTKPKTLGLGFFFEVLF